MNADVKQQLAPGGILRAAINLSNPLLVTGKAANGDPQGVSPDMAAAVAATLGVDPHALHVALETAVREHLEELGELRIRVD